jgi:hypothetical protein
LVYVQKMRTAYEREKIHRAGWVLQEVQMIKMEPTISFDEIKTLVVKEKENIARGGRGGTGPWTPPRMSITVAEADYLVGLVESCAKCLERAGGQLGGPNIGDACANASRTISHGLRELREKQYPKWGGWDANTIKLQREKLFDAMLEIKLMAAAIIQETELIP